MVHYIEKKLILLFLLLDKEVQANSILTSQKQNMCTIFMRALSYLTIIIYRIGEKVTERLHIC